MFTIDIPNEGMWNAVMCRALGPTHLVLENFRVHPFVEGVVRSRTAHIQCTSMYLAVDMPVAVHGKDVMVVEFDFTMCIVKYVDHEVLDLVPIDAISYRIQTTIDALDETTVEVQTFGGVRCLVPKVPETPLARVTVKHPTETPFARVTVKRPVWSPKKVEQMIHGPILYGKRNRTYVETYAPIETEIFDQVLPLRHTPFKIPAPLCDALVCNTLVTYREKSGDGNAKDVENDVLTYNSAKDDDGAEVVRGGLDANRPIVID